MNLIPILSFQPLEGLLATTGATAGSLVASQTASSTQMPAAHPATAYNPNKQSVPCFYFQKGLCLKGDRCPFMHESQPVVNPLPQQTSKVTASLTEPPRIIKKATGVLEKCTSQHLEKCTSQHKTSHVNITKPVQVPPTVNPAIDVEIVRNNGIAAKKTMPPAPLYDELPRTKPSFVPLIDENGATGPRGHQALPPDEHIQNGREAGEFLGESSPGFDVLVDDEIQDSDYFHHDDEYGRGATNGGRHLNSINEFDYDHSLERDSLAKLDRESYNEYQDYDQYRRPHDQFGWEHHRASSERILERSSLTERRRRREESPDQVDRSDLRHRLSKQRKVRGSRSATSPDRRNEINHRDGRYGEEQGYRGHPRRDQRHVPPETSISNRLQGRIMLPGISSPDEANDLRPDREMDRGRSWGRSSPGMPVLYQGRHHDRIRRTPENFTAEVRNFRGQPIKRDEVGTLNFVGPKSLAELKGSKVLDSMEEQSIKNNATAFKSQLVGEPKTMNPGKAVGHLEPEGSVSFEGPKPLSEILKRKRKAASGNGKVSSVGEDSSWREREEQIGGSEIAAKETPTTQVLDEAAGAVEENDDNDEDSLVATEGYDVTNVDPTSTVKGDTREMDGTMNDTTEDQELEAYDQRDGESDYELVEGGSFKTEDENAEPEDDYLDDDEDGEDDFSSKIGAILS